MQEKIIVKIPSRCIFNLASFDILNGFGGGYGVALDTESYLSISFCKNKHVIIPKKYHQVIGHYISVFQSKLGREDFFHIKIDFDRRIQSHSGFASNMMIACSVVYALNQFYQEPFSFLECIQLIKDNYIEMDSEHVFNVPFYTANALYLLFYGGFGIINKRRSLIARETVSDEMKCMIIKTKAYLKNIDERRLYFVALDKDKKFDLEREKIILQDLPQIIQEKNYYQLAHNTQYIQNRGGEGVFRNHIDSKICSLREVISSFEQERLVTGFTNSFDIFVFTKKLNLVKKICQRYSLNYEMFSIDNIGLHCIKETK